jgi:hypothetical protein
VRDVHDPPVVGRRVTDEHGSAADEAARVQNDAALWMGSAY